jgi:glucose-6-phosphate 1-dehydrogenase
MSETIDQPVVLVVFGITGDLAQRYILPALHNLTKYGQLPASTKIIGVSRRNVDVENVYSDLHESLGDEYDLSTAQSLVKNTQMRQMDLDSENDYSSLMSYLKDVEDQLPEGALRLYYLSVPPNAFKTMIGLLGKTGHASKLPQESDMPRLMVEKPFGRDLASARELLDVMAEYFDETQTYRIDHYVAKETVQNMVASRINTPQLAEIWEDATITKVTVAAYEKIDIEGRAEFYEQTGALRDFIQSHLIQVLALTLLQMPVKMSSEHLHSARLTALRGLEPINSENVMAQTVRGQYEGYRNEVGNSSSLIETYADLTFYSSATRWENVPLRVVSGKALDERLAFISIDFRSDKGEEKRLLLRIQPDPAIIIESDGGHSIQIASDYARLGMRHAEAYERVLFDAMRGDQTLFTARDEILRSWELVENILKMWATTENGLISYSKDSSGPIIQ